MVFWDPKINGSSKRGDVYSFAMTSFEVYFSYCEHPHYSVQSPCYDQVLTGILPYGNSDKNKMALILDTVNGHPAQVTKVGIDGCKTPSGI
jgi:hypothetical protein